MQLPPDTPLSQVGEDELIRQITESLPQAKGVVTGPGDDCAIVRIPGSDRLQLLKTDCIIESVHFLPEAEPEWIGWKAAARNVSDVAAMGGRPKHALVTLIVPGDRELGWVKQIYAGLRKCAEAHDFSIVGGETSRSPEAGRLTVISICMTGEVRAGSAVHRSAAHVGDEILVTGRLGGSLRGHHLSFRPRLEEGCWLAESGRVTAMMDLSDGLGQDLPRLSTASGIGYRVDRDALPLNEGCTVESAISDGEDYELLLTVQAGSAESLMTDWKARFPELPLTRIGIMVEKEMTVPIQAGWDHFGTRS